MAKLPTSIVSLSIYISIYFHSNNLEANFDSSTSLDQVTCPLHLLPSVIGSTANPNSLCSYIGVSLQRLRKMPSSVLTNCLRSTNRWSKTTSKSQPLVPRKLPKSRFSNCPSLRGLPSWVILLFATCILHGTSGLGSPGHRMT